MELKIDIPDELYKRLKTPRTASLTEAFDQRATLIRAIQNGIPLPKGHGRLKDIDKVEQLLDLDKADNAIAKALKNIIESVPTIIEADKEATNEQG